MCWLFSTGSPGPSSTGGLLGPSSHSAGTTLPPACPGHGHSGIRPRTFYCLQQVTLPCSRGPPWFSPFSLFIEKFVSCLIFRPQWISSGRRGWESDTLPIPFVSCCLFRWGGSFSLKEGEHGVREDSCGPSNQTGKCHSIVTLAPPAFELTCGDSLGVTLLPGATWFPSPPSAHPQVTQISAARVPPGRGSSAFPTELWGLLAIRDLPVPPVLPNTGQPCRWCPPGTREGPWEVARRPTPQAIWTSPQLRTSPTVLLRPVRRSILGGRVDTPMGMVIFGTLVTVTFPFPFSVSFLLSFVTVTLCDKLCVISELRAPMQGRARRRERRGQTWESSRSRPGDGRLAAAVPRTNASSGQKGRAPASVCLSSASPRRPRHPGLGPQPAPRTPGSPVPPAAQPPPQTLPRARPRPATCPCFQSRKRTKPPPQEASVPLESGETTSTHGK